MKVFEVIIGFAFGGILSGIVTVIWYKVFIPRIKFSGEICKYYDSTCEDEKNTYKIKFRNVGRRDIFEMNLYCTLGIRNMMMKGSIHSVDINLGYNFKPLFKKRKNGRNINPDGLVRISLNDEQMVTEFTRPIYSEEINKRAEKIDLVLKDLLNISPQADIKFYIIAHDEFTGSKKIFESEPYMKDNTKQGFYKSGELYVIG